MGRVAAFKKRVDDRETAMTTKSMAKSERRHKLEPGECIACDREREASFCPYHDASPRCESGKRPHCTCDVCF